MEELGMFLERKRKQKKMHKSDIYKGLGVSQNTYTNWITDPKLSLKNYVAICNFLNIDPSEYFNTKRNEHEILESGEPVADYQTEKKDDTAIMELIRQNGVLVDVIDRLTK